MKKTILALLLTVAMLLASGCDALFFFTSEDVTFSIDQYNLQITANDNFREKTGGAFDLQITNDHAYVSVMAYSYADLPDGVTPSDAFDLQNEELFRLRTDVTVVEEAKTQTLSQYVLTQALYSAKKDGVENYYATYLVDLPSEETFAWVLVSATPSYFKANRKSLHGIVCSLQSMQA